MLVLELDVQPNLRAHLNQIRVRTDFPLILRGFLGSRYGSRSSEPRPRECFPVGQALTSETTIATNPSTNTGQNSTQSKAWTPFKKQPSPGGRVHKHRLN